MKNLFVKLISMSLLFTLFIFSFLFVNQNHIKPVSADVVLTSAVNGFDVVFTMNPGANSSMALIVYNSSNTVVHDSGALGNISTYNWNSGPVPNGTYHAQVFAFGSTPFSNVTTFTLGGGGGGGAWVLSGPIVNGNNTVFSIEPPAGTGSTLAILETGYVSPVISTGATNVTWTAPGPGTYTAVLLLFTVEISGRNTFTLGGGGGGGSADLGIIKAPAGIPQAQNPTAFIGGFVRAIIRLLISAAFVIALIFLIINGIRFVTASGDSKTTSSATSQIWWTLIGLVVVLGSFAIIRLVETFFGVQIISGGFTLPNIN